jgi:hypothetical protein
MDAVTARPSAGFICRAVLLWLVRAGLWEAEQSCCPRDAIPEKEVRTIVS